MFDPHRTDTSRAVDAASGSDRDAKVEQLLLDGLDCYFAARYEQAINVWSRALFFDRDRLRARAYIERARQALAERQREAEELLEGGFAALRSGEHREAMRLLQDAVARGVASEEARAVLQRLDRVDLGTVPPVATETPGTVRRRVRPPLFRYRAHGPSRSRFLLLVAGVVAGSLWLLASAEGVRQIFADDAVTSLVPFAPPAVDVVPGLPLRAETALTRARMLAAGGRLHDAMAALDLVRPTDPQKGEADRLRADLQRRLIALTLPEDAAGDFVP
jgi:tetratricopeptide (TPR) repeat protein